MSEISNQKVLVVSTVHPARDPRIFDKQIRSLSDGAREIVWCRPGAADDSEGLPIGVREVTFPLPSSRMMRIFFAASRVRQVIKKERPALVHFHDPEILPVLLFQPFCGEIFIYDAHEDLPAQVVSKVWIPSFFRRMLSKIVGFVELRLSKRAFAVVAATPHIATRFAQAKISYVIARNYPRLDYFRAGVPEPKPKDLVYIGRISKDRGLERMLHLAQTLDARLHLAGRIEPDCEPLVRRGEKEGKCVYLGILDREEVLAMLSRGGIGLCLLSPEPNYLNSLPTKLFEYMSQGLPVICTDFPGFRQIIMASGAGLCVDVESSDFVDRIRDWLETVDLESVGRNGRKYVLEAANWEHEFPALDSLYRTAGV